MSRRLLILILAMAGSVCHAGVLDGTEARLMQILTQMQALHRADTPMYRCLLVGRLQASLELLNGNLARLESRQSHTEANKQALVQGKAWTSKIQKILPPQIGSCSSSFQGPAKGIDEPSLAGEIKKLKRKLNSTGAEDPVIRCFHIGRLSVWTGGLKRLVARANRKGEPVEPKTLQLLDSTIDLVDKEIALSCRRTKT